jgi:diguanylate cyclase (GGDEF)-like protein
MSFRTRLTSFFVLIVVVPMIAVAFLVFRLIGDSEQGKADARANGLATAAASLYTNQSAAGRVDAQTIGRSGLLLSRRDLSARLSTFAARAGLARVVVSAPGHVLADVGDHAALAPGLVTVKGAPGGVPLTVRASAITAGEYARDLGSSPGGEIIVHEGPRQLYSTVSPKRSVSLPRRGTVKLGSDDYEAVTQSFKGFGAPVEVTVLSNRAATATSVTTSRIVAAAFIVGFLLLAVSFSFLASRALHGQISRFLEAAKRIGSGDFESRVPIEGNDEFAELGEEFNQMSAELETRLEELSQERARLRVSIRRIGETLASNLDRPALLELALRSAVDAVQADSGRLTARQAVDDPLAEAVRVGSLGRLEAPVHEAERAALQAGGLGESSAAEGVSVLAVALGAIDGSTRTRGVITVTREGRPFSDDDRELLRSLAAQATLALRNVQLHFQVRRQAVTDELTGLANHGRFQDLLSAEVEQVRRYHHPVGLIMLDIDDFKSVNDTYGHQQGDVVLREVARILRDCTREVDEPARYGGEELAVALQQTDLGGAEAIAERVRTTVEALALPRLDGDGALHVTVSCGVAASADGDPAALVAAADAALYAAKRAGKNRTVRADGAPVAAVSGEGPAR